MSEAHITANDMVNLTEVVEISAADTASSTWLSQSMFDVAFSHVLVLAVALFLLGLFGVWLGQRRFQSISLTDNQQANTQTRFIKLVFSMQLMLLAVILIFMAAGRYWQTADGQLVALVILVYAGIQLLLMLFFVNHSAHVSNGDSI